MMNLKNLIIIGIGLTLREVKDEDLSAPHNDKRQNSFTTLKHTSSENDVLVSQAGLPFIYEK